MEKVESDLNYAVLKLSNEFSKGFEDGLPSEVCYFCDKISVCRVYINILHTNNNNDDLIAFPL